MADVNLVCVYASGDPMQVEIYKAMLEAEGIPAAVHGGQIADLFGIGRFVSGANLALGPVQLMVRATDREQAMKLIEQHYGKNAANIDIPEEEWNAKDQEDTQDSQPKE